MKVRENSEKSAVVTAKPKLNLQFKPRNPVDAGNAFLAVIARATPISAEGVSAVDFILADRRMSLGSVSPKVVAQVAFGLARFFSVQSVRFHGMLPESVKTVTDIACKRFASGHLEMLLFYKLNDTTARLMGVKGFEVTIPDPTSHMDERMSLSPEVCLVFTCEGKFVLAEKKDGKCLLTVLNEKKLAALVKRFPALKFELTMHFFIRMIQSAMTEVAFVHREMLKFEELALGVANRLTQNG